MNGSHSTHLFGLLDFASQKAMAPHSSSFIIFVYLLEGPAAHSFQTVELPLDPRGYSTP